MAAPYGIQESYITEPEVPQSVSKTFDEATQTYTFSFKLTKDEHDALRVWGTNAEQEVDAKVILFAKGIIKDLAHKYATDCFNAKQPLDCMCETTLFRRMCKKRAEANESK